MFIIDFSNIMYEALYTQGASKDLLFFEKEENVNKIKHFLYYSIFNLAKKMKSQPENIILAIDSKENWRKKYFEHYKCRRALRRKASDIDFKSFYLCCDEVIEVFKQLSPVKVVKEKYCEGDDIIYVLSEYLSSKGKDVLVASTDKDMFQVLRFPVKLYNKKKKKYLDLKKYEVDNRMNKHILTGDTNDDIPNVYSDDDTFANPNKRQKRLGDVTAEKIINENRIAELLKDENIKNNIIRNKRLIDMKHIPKKLKKRIIKKYLQECEKDVKIDEMIKYLQENNMVNVITILKGDYQKVKMKEMMKEALKFRRRNK
jgi:DNA polymerase-1